MDPVEETINTYNGYADEYYERYIADGDGTKMQLALDKFLSFITTGQEILDVGSGAGFDAKYLSEKDYKVTSIDIADKLLEVAKKVAPVVNFVKMDARKLAFEEDSFDGIWACASLLHLPKNEFVQTLPKLYSTLKTDGVFYLGLKQGAGEEYKVNSGEGNLSGARRFFAYYSKEEVENLLNKTGFEIIDYFEDVNRSNIWMGFFCRK